MKLKANIFVLTLALIVSSCAKKVDYSEEFMIQTSGNYLYNPDELIGVYYENNKMFIKWRGANKIEPVILDETTIFIADMYKKLQFVKHPQTNKQYLSVVSNDDEASLSYDYIKVAELFKTPSMHLKNGDLEKAIQGYLVIKEQDSTSALVSERGFNRQGYALLREKKYQDAINMFTINVSLYPESDNVYDSLADAYERSGDSLQAYNNYKKALEFNTGNKRAKRFIEKYSKE